MTHKAIAVLGGTFDPIHHGHLRSALDVLEVLGLSQIRFVPNAIPPHRVQPQATIKQRLHMVQLAIAGESRFIVDERELMRAGTSYTVDTLRAIRQEIGAQTPLCLIVGQDAFAGLSTWAHWQQLLDYAHIVVMARAGAVAKTDSSHAEWHKWVKRYRTEDKQAILNLPAGRIWTGSMRLLDISATEIRKRLAQGHSVQYLLPESVVQYIAEQQLYCHTQA